MAGESAKRVFAPDPGHPRLGDEKGVDARHSAGHDEERATPKITASW
jgi:hypothetical protein